MSQPTVCLLSLKAPCFLTIGNRMKVFDPCESGWVLVQRRCQRCSQGQGKTGKESEVQKASFVFSNRAFSVGKKASFNFARSSGDCRDKASSISRPFCVSSAPDRSGLLVTPGTRDIRSLSAPDSCEFSLGDVFNESVVHGASGFTSGGGWGGSPSRCDPKCGQREGAMTRSEDDQLCTVSESPASASRRRWSVPPVPSAETVYVAVESELSLRSRVYRAVHDSHSVWSR